MTSHLHLPEGLRAQIREEASTAFPNECCGLIEGAREGESVSVLALHPARNLATRSDRFEIDPAEQFRLMHALQGTGRAIVGCYHSHPNGIAEPSAFDQECASGEGFVWLIAAVKATSKNADISAFFFENRAFLPVVLTIA